MFYKKTSLACLLALISSIAAEISPFDDIQSTHNLKNNFAEVFTDGSTRKLQNVGSISIPGIFYGSAVRNNDTDIVGAMANQYQFVVNVQTGSSVVYSFDVTKAGTYEVSFGMVAKPPDGLEAELRMGFLPGRVTCPPSGEEGAVYIEKFTTEQWAVPVNYLGTNLTLAEGLNQEYTLCFERAFYVNLNYVCISTQCSKIDGTELANVIPVRPVVPLPLESDDCQPINNNEGVKGGSCIQILCAPEYISLGSDFNVDVRFCNSHSRKWELSLKLLDDVTQQYVMDFSPNTVYTSTMALSDDVNNPVQLPTPVDGPDGTMCGEYTFTLNFDPFLISKDVTTQFYLWQFFLKPMWYDGLDEIVDKDPNYLGISFPFNQPKILPQDYAMPLNDCPLMEKRNFTAQNVGQQNLIRFTTKPDCITIGESWKISLDVHVETMLEVDVRVNLQTGVNGVYLGAEDVFIAEANTFGVPMWTEGDPFWTPIDITYSRLYTKALTALDTPYIAAFFVPAGSIYDELTGGWQIVEREFNLSLEICPEVAV